MTIWQAHSLYAAGPLLLSHKATSWSLTTGSSEQRLAVHCSSTHPMAAAQQGLRFLQSAASAGACKRRLRMSRTMRI